MRLLKNSIIQNLASHLIYFYLKLVYRTNKWQIIGADDLWQYLGARKPAILAFWHSRLSMIVNFIPFPQEMYTIASRHGDGEFIAKIQGKFGVQFIRGSTNREKNHKKGAKNRGGAEALRAAIKIIKNGKTVCITPDGPKGPRMKINSAIAELAKLTGAPVYPVSFSTSRAKFFDSWDRFLLPLPFGHGYFIASDPVVVPRGAGKNELEKIKKEIENRLNQITQKADILAGHSPIKPE